MKKVICSPSKYIQGKGLTENLAEYYKVLGTTIPFILCDEFIAKNYKENIEKSFKQENITPIFSVFGGECSKVEINRKSELLQNADVVIGIGGGKTLDTAKAIAYYKNMPVIIVPTIASTDAPCSALSVLYSEDGAFEEYLFLRSNPQMVIMDTQIIVNAPSRLLVAGMGDALATYYEARACYSSGATSIAGGKSTAAALTLAKLCLDTLFADGYKAKISAESKAVTKAFENVVEANTYLSGIGFESGGLAAAHAIHNGFTVLKECHNMFHGEKVAFGTIVQLVLENATVEELGNVISWCKALGLPTCLAELGAAAVSHEDLINVAKAAAADTETIHNMPFEVTWEDVYSAILVADKMGQ